MKILVLGSDGYIGYPLVLHLLKRGNEVMGVDDYSRRRRVNEIGSKSLIPIEPAIVRKSYLSKNYPNYFSEVGCSLGNDSAGFIKSILHSFRPDTIVHLAEQPSAPWSMKNAEFAKQTQLSNVLGTLDLLWAIREVCPRAHLIKLGSMGEYGTPECDIPEGTIPEGCIGSHESSKIDGYIKTNQGFVVNCPMAGLPFPRSPNSFYHLSKVHDTHNIIFASKTWDLTCTDIMQGVVFGVNRTNNEMELTRFDYDECFGTVINRFCVQAMTGQSLTVYGEGNQTRGFLSLNDSIECLSLAIDNPPERGDYRTFNQFGHIISIHDLARMIVEEAEHHNMFPAIISMLNPRTELDGHYYNPRNLKLNDLGYIPSSLRSGIAELLASLRGYIHEVNKDVMLPTIAWGKFV